MIRIGTSGFSFDDWVGPAYPEGTKKPDMLAYYAKEFGFDCVELNFTYYAVPSQKSFISMQEKVPADFEFVVKGNRGITHDPFDSRLPKRPTFEKAAKVTLAFAEALEPLKSKGQLGAVLLQFPVFFEPNSKNCDYMMKCKYLLKGIPLVIEFRNSKWAQKESFDFLRNNKFGYCAVDEPKLPRLMPFVPEVTSDIGYLRFHGRNTDWFNAPVERRYDYLYTEAELKGFIPAIKEMSGKCGKFYNFFNNCHLGSAVKNARDLKILLKEENLI